MPRKKSESTPAERSAAFITAVSELIKKGEFDLSQAERLTDNIVQNSAKKPSA